MTWVLPVMGIWLIIAPWVVQDITTTAGTIFNNVIIGVLVVVFGVGLWAMGMSRRTTTT
jgi:uncharacterized membrane protein YidH (DUF202 family)